MSAAPSPAPSAVPRRPARSARSVPAPSTGRPLARVTAAAVTVSALAASLAGCLSVSDAEPPKPSGSTARQDGKDAEPGPGGVTADGRGEGPRRMGRNGEAQRMAGAEEAAEPSARATPKASVPATPKHPVEPSGPEPGAAHGGSGGNPDPAPSHPDRPSSPPPSTPPSTPPAEPTPQPSSPPPSAQASGLFPSSPMSSQVDPGA
ncbi:hypothetical protein QOM21_19295 [Streptomyces sp. Pv4-95]|uniref:hypothetical protein n=1 Tax=Streptomyces sp. Pv4-95 TaxID=3049543 RepID=UPI003892A4F5